MSTYSTTAYRITSLCMFSNGQRWNTLGTDTNLLAVGGLHNPARRKKNASRVKINVSNGVSRVQQRVQTSFIPGAALWKSGQQPAPEPGLWRAAPPARGQEHRILPATLPRREAQTGEPNERQPGSAYGSHQTQTLIYRVQRLNIVYQSTDTGCFQQTMPHIR